MPGTWPGLGHSSCSIDLVSKKIRRNHGSLYYGRKEDERDEFAAEIMSCIHDKLGNDGARLLWLQQLSIFMGLHEFSAVLGAENAEVLTAEVVLHVGVNHAWTDGNRDDFRLLMGQSHVEMVQRRLGGAVHAPAVDGSGCSTGRGEDDSATNQTKMRDALLDLLNGWLANVATS